MALDTNTLVNEASGTGQPQTLNPSNQELINQMAQEKHAATLLSDKQNIGERKLYADRIYWFTVSWSSFIALMLLLCAADKIHLSDLVLTTLIGSFAAQVFGFLYLVFKYLFYVPDSK